MTKYEGADREQLLEALERHQSELESKNQQLRDATQALEEAKARNQHLSDLAPISYCTLSPSGVLLEVNEKFAAMLNERRQSLIGTPLTRFIIEADQSIFMLHLARCADAQENLGIEVRFSVGQDAPEVEPRTFEIVSSPGSEGFRTVLIDITDRKRVDANLRLSLRMRQDFLAIVSHDLRNPLNSIMMSAEVLSRQTPKEALTALKQIENVKNGARRITRLLADLIDLSNIEAGQFSMERDQYDVAKLIKAAAEAIAPAAAEKFLKIVSDLVPSPLQVFADRERVIQVLMNLLTNAVKFTAVDGTITLEAVPHEKGVQFVVRDTGSGIVAEQIPSLFKAYWHGVKTVRGATGLGLSISRGIVESHNGSIWVESTRGGGSAFFFTLPSYGKPSTPLFARPSAPAATEAKPSLMIVDDEELARESLAQLLELEGYEVLMAENGKVALEMLASGSRPSVILLDLMMPVLDGWQFLEARKADASLSALPVVLISGQADSATVATSYPRTNSVQKPVPLSQLLTILSVARQTV